jgi:PAS domain S-box-containing protein
MGIAAGGNAEALADLATALTAAATRVDAVAGTAVRAAARLVGDCAGIRLVGEDDGYDTVTAHHPGPEQYQILAEILPGRGDDDRSAALRGSRTPLPPIRLDDDGFQRVAPLRYRPLFERAGIHTLLVCPLVADNTYLGHLTMARTVPGSGYTADEIDLAGDIAARTALAVTTAAAMQRLRRSEERYRRIVETTLDGVWQLDGQGLTTFVNDRMVAILGLPRQQLIGLSMRGFLDNAGQAQLPGRLAQRSDGHGEVYECRLIRADGTPIWVQISAAPISGDGAGRPPGLLCMVTDITERVTARDTRRQLDQLRRQDAVGQLAGGIAHDFNNLLTVIAGSAEILATDLDSDRPAHQLATQIVEAAARGADLTHQLLSFGRRSPHAQTVAMPQLLDGVRQLLTRAMGERIQLDVHTAPDLWPVHADRGQLEQALVNLATNARDAMGRGGVLTIEAANTVIEPGQLDDPGVAGRFVQLSVSDTGIGMDADGRQHAFEAFYTTKTASGAAGLGLSTVHSIITACGGHVWLRSEPGIGTTVNLYVPAVDQPATDSPGPAVDGPSGNGHILVVEDQPELAQLTRYLLQPAGYHVTVTTDAAAAIAALDTGTYPDLLLTDVVMPGMTGPELAATLRARHPDLRVLFMSGYTAGVLTPQGHLDNNATLLQKPFNRHTLLTAVAQALNHR